ncbi:probable LRR receptor-like serine/threonine-protein kinase At3g47570 [Gossypium hirsutum]|nr:probable LRR receptor-like serine/threonine-protein kinase At3g47570 [Gossypium hirsutum]
MEQSRKHLEVSSSFFLVYVEVIILLSCFNLQGLNLLGLASPVAGGNETDQQALLQFKAKIIGDQLRSWNSSIHFCQWLGVTCGRKHRRVTRLELQFQKLSGSLSPYIGNLSFLRELNLSGNSFRNDIPQEIGGLRRLETLSLINNSLSGEIPSNLSACSKLTLVDMTGNQLTGEIPSMLGSLSNLKVLNLQNNSLRGSIPPSLGNLSSLEVLSLAINRLTGIIPEAFRQLTNLSDFSVAQNAISGIVPVAMFNLSNIRLFDIGQNKIQGTLHSDISITMPYVEFFSITGNQISGQIPLLISNASNLNVLHLADNKLSGNVPSLEKLNKLYKCALAINHLGHGEEGDLNFLCTLVNNTKLEFLYLIQNNFGGVFPECISNYSSTLLHLVIGENKISGRIPDGIGNLINLEFLAIAQNQLSGHIPFDIGRLQKLKIFSADNNFLSGIIPYSIGNLTMLTKLGLGVNNLQGNIPSSLGKCLNLLEINISYNNLNGSIPPEVLELSSLSIELDLSSNYLTGQLPVEVEKLKNLGYLDVSQNKLSGLLPNNLGSCVSMEKLLLDGNSFEGSIPSSLSSLRGLEALDVSNNNLSGGIPEFLVNFGALKYLNLSFNDFEGVVPSEGVFKNASATFVEGNNKLCGGIPELHLSRCNSKPSSNTSLRLKIAIVVVILGVTFLFSFLLIMWFRKKKEKQSTTTCVESSLLQLSYQSILRATDGFSTQNLVGSGSFGSVYKGVLEASGAVIAVKVLNLLNRGASRSFLAECEALKNIRHRNLVKVLTAISGVNYQGNDFKALVYEFMENGSLEDWLHPFIGMNEPETARNLNFFQRVSVAIDVAHALEYLHHHCEEPIIHCDLKPSNILLDEEMVGHISDFGLAKILSADKLNYSTNQSSSLGLRGTIGYAPPEYGLGSELSTKGDVYSYGILLLEMFTGKRPTHDMFKAGFSIHNIVMVALPERITEIIDPILLQERSRHRTPGNITFSDRHLQHLNSIFEIGLACSAESPSERMDMSDIVSKLCSIRDKLLRPTHYRHERQTLNTAQSTGT